jgi:AraC-like DNA-binding protein
VSGARQEPTVFTHAVALAVATASITRGRTAEELCAELGLDPARLADPGSRVPHGAVARAWKELSEATDDFGLRAARLSGSGSHSLAEYAMLNAPDVRAALSTFVRLAHLFHDAATHSLDVTPKEAVLRFGVEPPLTLPNALWDFLVARHVERLRTLLGADVSPVLVELPRGPFADEAAAQAMLRAPVAYRRPPAVHWPRAVLDRPVPSHDPHLYVLLTRQLDAAAGAPAAPLLSGAERDLLVELRRALRASVLRGDAAIGPVARQLGTSSRTLQRKLAERDTTFAEQLDEARKAVALTLLAERGTSVKHAALTSGFSQVAAFSRAFRRWTGRSPAAWLREQPAAR